MTRSLAALLLVLLLTGCFVAGCTPALVRTCPANAVRYSDETSLDARERVKLTYRVEWSCVPASQIERSK